MEHVILKTPRTFFHRVSDDLATVKPSMEASENYRFA
jgi:hypothetical protein